MKIRINRYLSKTSVEGPGQRFCIWVQGCSLRCKGCANSHMWDKSGGTEYEVSDIVDIILRYSDEIEGVTFLGGEPLDQSEAVFEIARSVRKKGLSVLIFTGYEYEKIKDLPKYKDLENLADILIDGRYDDNLRDLSRPWVGSSNQKYYFFSDRYSEDIIAKYRNKFEVHFGENNEVFVNGMGNYDRLKELIK